MTAYEGIRELVNPAFRFVVKIDNQPQAAFTECSLPTLEFDAEEVKEGGQNQYTHLLPGRRKSARITLKNGVGKSMLLDWYLSTLTPDAPPKRKDLTITLYNVAVKPFMIWHIESAYPIKWVSPQLKSDENAVAVQTLELICGGITVSLESAG